MTLPQAPRCCRMRLQCGVSRTPPRRKAAGCDGSDDDRSVVDPPDRETPDRMLPNIWSEGNQFCVMVAPPAG